ncbi:unnamed protein product [Pedinophyceae sp. YPF-701]|nr:unnamed protein product [Pedinophyceae sp. YPF-701]
MSTITIGDVIAKLPAVPEELRSLDVYLVVKVALAAALVYVAVSWLLTPNIPTLDVPMTPDEEEENIDAEQYVPAKHDVKGKVPCYDPATMYFLGYQPAMTRSKVVRLIDKARAAQEEWETSSFAQRRMLMRIILKYIIDHQREICRVAARDSGKPLVDAAFGEVLVTCEKLRWLAEEGEQYLRPERRPAGAMMFYKSARVEYVPVGVVGAIVPFNYPFHNVFNPLTAALFAGNAIVIKVSEHASWSVAYYKRIIDAALEAAGAPKDLVQIVTGYAEAGNAVVTGGCDKVIFVGSTEVGKKVMQAAADTLTPVVLELGGKDAFIICDDARLDEVVPTALRGAFQSCGQNCAGAERFFVHESLIEEFAKRVAAVAKSLRQGPPTGAGVVDCGAMCLPGLAEKVQELVDDAIAKGAKCFAGGNLPRGGASKGMFYPPTVLIGVTPEMRIWAEEVFGPVLVACAFSDDDEAVELANDCPFGLGSSVFSRDQARARRIAENLEAGMSSINDFATTYMCQSLPFGGVKDSGFDRFAGIEGLRGLCVPKAVCEDRVGWLMRTTIPPPLQYPVADSAFDFVSSLIKMFYGYNLGVRARGLVGLAKAALAKPKKQ